MLVLAIGAQLPDELRWAVVAVGAFDGVHRGHQAVLEVITERAAALARPAVVLTVEPPSVPALADLEQRRSVLEATGVDAVVLSADETAALAQAARLEPSVVVTGPGAAVDVGGAAVVRVPAVDDAAGSMISADAVHAALERGDVERAGDLLGRPFALRGVVETGDRRGREMGFPTANVAVEAHLALPADGVYGGRYRRADGTDHVAAVSIGRRPTFYDETGVRLVEVHLLDFEGDLYGERPEISFDCWVRGQVRFDGVDALVAQMQEDVAAVRERAASAGG